jgi:putative hydroxymethylpyrimidine transport system ATP-binding protein
MRQRTALARTLMEDQPIALLDEPFSALDASTRADMQELSAEVLADKTVLLVTHDPAEAVRLGHQIIVLTPDAAQLWPTPQIAPIRDQYEAETVACQAQLLACLRGTR